LETKNNSILIRPITVILLLFTLISVQIFVSPQAAIAQFEIIIKGKPQSSLTKAGFQYVFDMHHRSHLL
jgi:hypothetical protein